MVLGRFGCDFDKSQTECVGKPATPRNLVHPLVAHLVDPDAPRGTSWLTSWTLVHLVRPGELLDGIGLFSWFRLDVPWFRRPGGFRINPAWKDPGYFLNRHLDAPGYRLSGDFESLVWNNPVIFESSPECTSFRLPGDSRIQPGLEHPVISRIAMRLVPVTSWFRINLV